MSRVVGLGISTAGGELVVGSGGGSRRDAFLVKDANLNLRGLPFSSALWTVLIVHNTVDPLLSHPINFPAVDPNHRLSAALSFTSVSSLSSSIGPLSSSDGGSSSPEQGPSRKFPPTNARPESPLHSQRSTNPEQGWQALSFGGRSRAGSVVGQNSPDSTSIRSSASTTSSPSVPSSPDLDRLAPSRKPDNIESSTPRLRAKTSQKFALRKAASSVTLSSSSKSLGADTTERTTLRGNRPNLDGGTEREKANSTRSTTGRYRKARPDVLTFDFHQLLAESASAPLLAATTNPSSSFVPPSPPTSPTTIRARPRSRTIGKKEGEKEKPKSSGMFGFLKWSSSPVPILHVRSTSTTLFAPPSVAPRSSTDSKDDGARRSFWNQLSRNKNTASPPGEKTESDGSSVSATKGGGSHARRESPLPWFRRSRTESSGAVSSGGDTKRKQVVEVVARDSKPTFSAPSTPSRRDSTPPVDGHILPFEILKSSLASSAPLSSPSLKNKISGSFRYPTQLSPPSRRPSLTPALLSPPLERPVRPIASRRLPATMRISMVVERADLDPSSLSPLTPTGRIHRAVSVESFRSSHSVASVDYNSDSSLV